MILFDIGPDPCGNSSAVLKVHRASSNTVCEIARCDWTPGTRHWNVFQLGVIQGYSTYNVSKLYNTHLVFDHWSVHTTDNPSICLHSRMFIDPKRNQLRPCCVCNERCAWPLVQALPGCNAQRSLAGCHLGYALKVLSFGMLTIQQICFLIQGVSSSDQFLRCCNTRMGQGFSSPFAIKGIWDYGGNNVVFFSF